MSLLQKLADDKPVVTSKKDNEPEVTIIRRTKMGSCKDNQLEGRDPEGKEVLPTYVQSIPEEVLMETTLGRKKCHLGRRQRSTDQIKSPGSV